MNILPDTIDKRYFVCKKCGYTVQVYGEMYFDFGFCNYIATFHCKKCHKLYEDVITKVEEWDTKEDLVYTLQDEQICLSCGSKRCNIWNHEYGKCPKCEGDIDYFIDGKIKLKHSN